MNATIARQEIENALYWFCVFLGSLHGERWASGDSHMISPWVRVEHRIRMRELHRRAVDWSHLAGPPGAWDAKSNAGVP